MQEKIEAWLRQWFIARHGVGADNQADVYRCFTCARIRTWNQISRGDVCCMGRVIPSEPTIWEAVKLLVTRT